MLELLAPAGNMEKLKFALHYGADAVYLAGTGFGLRAFAGNFTNEELPRAIEYAHNAGKKVYITVNIFAHNQDIKKAGQYLQYLQSIGADAVIISDIGLVAMARELCPNLPVHISTQANVTNYRAAQFYHSLGASRVILARELSLEEIKTIRENTPPQLELEAFVHGAMCISYSGRCLLSNFLAGRGSNQGMCVQSCRWKYALVEEQRPGQYLPIEEDERGTYILNSKDLCMINHIEELAQAGITSFKIEGRMKSIYYNSVVTHAYRRAIDAYQKGEAPPEGLLDELSKAASRQFTTGFYFGKSTQETQQYEASKYPQLYEIAAIVKGYDEENKRLILEQRNKFSVGDTLEIVSPTKNHGKTLKVEQIINDNGEEQEAAPHPQQTIFVPSRLSLQENDILSKRQKE